MHALAYEPSIAGDEGEMCDNVTEFDAITPMMADVIPSMIC